nr:zinc finger protein 550-like [Aedes albopictus]
MYGCPHCYRIVKNKPAFEKHVNACKKKKYSCELCEFRSNELNLLDKHKEARHPKEYNQEENEVAKAEAMDTVEGEEDKTALKPEISVEESKVNSLVREDRLDTKTESDGSCKLPDSKVVTINMEFTAEETKLSKLTDKRLVVLLDNSLGEAFRKGLANNENRRLHDDASVTEASTPETSSQSELIPAGISSNQESEEKDVVTESSTPEGSSRSDLIPAEISSNQESEEMDVDMASSETNISEVKIKNEPIISDELLGGSENGNDQDSQPLDNEDTSPNVDEVAEADADVQNQDKPFQCPFCERAFHSMPARKHHRVTVHRDQYECAHCARKYPYKCRLLKHLKVHFESLQSDSDKKVTFIFQLQLNLRCFPCPICKKVYASQSAMQSHKPQKCPICEVEFPNLYRLNDHVFHEKEQQLESQIDPAKIRLTVHGEPQFPCAKCERPFYFKSELKRHELIHLKHELGYLPPQEKKTLDPMRSVTCYQCNRRFPNRKIRHHHTLTATENRSTNVPAVLNGSLLICSLAPSKSSRKGE